MKFVLKTRTNSSASQYVVSSQRSSPRAISHGFPSVHDVHTSVSLPPNAASLLPSEALPKLFPQFPPSSMLYRSLPAKLSASYLQHFLSVPAKLSASYFRAFLSVQHAVSLPPSEALRKRFPRFRLRPTCSIPAKLSASYLQHFLSVQHAASLPPSEALRKLFARFPIRPACCIAPSQRSSPQAICSISSPSSMLYRSLPAKLSPSYFHGFPPSSMLYRSLPAKLSANYFHGFLSVQYMLSRSLPAKLPASYLHHFLHPACCLAPSQRSTPQAIPTVSSVQHAVSLQRSSPQAICTVSYPSSMLFVPSQRSSPRAIFTVSCPSSMLHRSLPAKLSASYLHGFLSVQHAVSLPPSKALRKLFAAFPLRPACCIAPSQRSSPQAISTVSSPSSMLYRSLPAPRFPIRPVCCLAPSQRSSPQAISTVSSPSNLLYRSLPAKLSASYLHGFLSVQHVVSLPPSEALRKLFAVFPLRPACCLAPSQRSSPQAISTVSHPSIAPSEPSSPQAICTVSYPSSMLYRSLPAKLSASYLHHFHLRPACCIAPPSEALPKLFPRFPVRPAGCIAPSQKNYPQAICTVSYPSSMLSRSLPRPVCCLAPSLRSSPQVISTVSSPSSVLSLLPSEALRKLFALPLPASLPSFPPSFLLFRFLPSFLLSFLPPFLPSLPLPPFLPSFLLSFLPISVQHSVSLPPPQTRT